MASREDGWVKIISTMVMAIAAFLSLVGNQAMQAQSDASTPEFIPKRYSPSSLRTAFAAMGIRTTKED